MADEDLIEVVLVEDNDVYREALELMLEVTPDIRVVAAVGDGEAALEVCRQLAPDVVLVDYRLPGLDGVETTTELRSACPDAAVVVLTATVETAEVQALRAEAHVERDETPVGMAPLRVGQIGRRVEDDGRVLSR